MMKVWTEEGEEEEQDDEKEEKRLFSSRAVMCKYSFSSASRIVLTSFNRPILFFNDSAPVSGKMTDEKT